MPFSYTGEDDKYFEAAIGCLKLGFAKVGFSSRKADHCK